MESLQVNKDWEHTSIKNFWGELAPYEHVVQFYENDEAFLELLFGFVLGGIDSGDCTIVIATPPHLDFLHLKLKTRNLDPADLARRNLFIALDADTSLSEFMVSDWPDEKLFTDFVSLLISKAKLSNQKVRAFGEMVALLWAKGQIDATVRLEYLWNKFCDNKSLALFCAYPQSGFTQDARESIDHICGTHAKLISGVVQSKTEVFYKDIL
jgi:hypothetical protein